MLESNKRVEIPDKSEAWEVKGHIWRDGDKIIFMDPNGTERVLSDLQVEVIGEVLQEDVENDNLHFITSKPFEGLRLFRNGMRQTVTTDYTITAPNKVLLTVALDVEDVLMADFTTKEV
jgi:hypothetical protein